MCGCLSIDDVARDLARRNQSRDSVWNKNMELAKELGRKLKVNSLIAADNFVEEDEEELAEEDEDGE